MEAKELIMLRLLTHNQYLENRIKGMIENYMKSSITNMVKENLASVGNIPASELNITTILRRYEYDPPSVVECDFCLEDKNHFHSRIIVTRHSPGLANSCVQVDHEELLVGSSGPEGAIQQGLWKTFLMINKRIELLVKNDVPVLGWRTPQE